MRHQAKSARQFAIGAFLGLAAVVAGCSGSSGSGGFFNGDGGGGPDGTVARDGGGGGLGGKEAGHPLKLSMDSGPPICTPPSCTELHANCGYVTDKVCSGPPIQCGVCGAGESCGAGGTPNRCATGVVQSDGGFTAEGCAKQTCASQHISCGIASDGCGGMLACGTCNVPQTCGGGATPGVCGCTGECAAVVACSGTTTTELIGTVLDPAMVNPLYNVLVYVPNDPTDPGLQPFPPGISCDSCGAAAAGDPLVTTYTAPDGTFTLSGVPVGPAIPLVIQLGHWRRQFTIPVTTPCAANSVPAGTTLSMPQNHTQGDLPRIAVITGGYDPVECALRDFGISDSEFTDPGGGGYINFYLANDPNDDYPAYDQTGPGAAISSSTPTQDALFAPTGAGDGGAQPLINNYDMVLIECEGYQQAQTQVQEAALAAYLGAGGRMFGSDFIYDWLYDNPALQGASNWGGFDNGGGVAVTATIDLPPANPQGTAFDQWLEIVGVSLLGSDSVTISPAFLHTPSVIAPTQEWLHSGDDGVGAVHFTFNTPLGALPAAQCGRATFSDWHAFSGVLSGGTTFPAACGAAAGASHQEKILEFMLFDLAACVQPYTPICTPTTCAAQNIECGPAGDGCGNLIAGGCGACATGQSCGGGGSGKCGTMTSTMMCMPETCIGQGIQCGPAGDGCGNELQCGNCPTGQICGFMTPGVCGGMTGPA